MDFPEPLPTPATYHPEHAERARKLGLVGETTDEDLAHCLKVSVETLHEWQSAVPAFAKAVQDGRIFADADAADGLHRSATGPHHQADKIFMFAAWEKPLYAPYTRHYPPNGTSALRWLERRRPKDWGKKTQIEVKHNHVEGNYSNEELARKLLGFSAAARSPETGDPQ
jgi:hypothetical protein